MHKIYLSLLLVSFTYAQTVSFEEVLKSTLKNSKELKKQESNIQLNKLDRKVLESISYGKLSFIEEVSRTNHPGYVFNSKLSSREATFNDFGAGQFNPSDLSVIPENLNNPEDRNNFTTKITYDIPLFTGFKLSNQKDILKLQEKANEIKYNKDKKELAYEVLKAYNNAVVAKDYIQTINKAKSAISYLVKSASAFHNEGLVTKIDVKQAQVYELNINSQLIQAQNNFDLSIAYLKFLTSNDNITNVQDLKNINSSILNKKNTYTTALENRDEIKMQNANISAMKKNVDMSNSSYYPSIYSHLEYGFNDNVLTINDEKDYYMAMIGLNYTLFDNTRDIEKQKSKIKLAKASLDFENLKDAIKLEVEKAHLDLKAKEKILKEKIEAMNLAKEILEQSTLMYKNHLISMTNLLEQEANLRKNETQLIMANYEKSLSLAKLALVLGQDFSNENKGK